MFKTNFLLRTSLCLIAISILSLSSNAKINSFKTGKTKVERFCKNANNKLTASITMEESILRVDTGDPDTDIQTVLLIKLKGFYVKALNNCRQPYCQYNLEKFPKGLYKVIVFTSNGNTFNRTVILR